MSASGKPESEQNEVGTPQGGVISPLLCNIALHGMETELLNNYGRDRVKIIRYADDFVITGKRLEDIVQAKIYVTKFLATVGLELSKEKTRIGHTLHPMEGSKTEPGFDFLGYTFRNITVSKKRGVKNTRGVRNDFIQTSGPSKDSIRNHKKAIKEILRQCKSAPREAVITKLSARIQG